MKISSCWHLVATALILAEDTTLCHADSHSASFWAIYPDGDAEDACLGLGNLVDDSCCTSAPIQTDPIAEQFPDNSNFVIEGLLEGGESLQSYLGCDDDGAGANVPTYGEACYGSNEFGLIPANVTVDSTNPDKIEDCGCTFQVMGNGCHKIRDFGSLPGHETDVRQVFLFMNETCDDDNNDSDTMPGEPTASPTEADNDNNNESAAGPMMDFRWWMGCLLFVGFVYY